MKKAIELMVNEQPYLINPKFLKKSRFQEPISSNISQCLNCERKCKIQLGKLGHCQTRVNYKGSIFSLVHGAIIAKSVNPIEKKPLFHFHPGTKALTIGTYGCNFDCFWCQNHDLSHPELDIMELLTFNSNYYSPEEMIKDAIKENCQGTSISFNEPTLLTEYSLEVFELAHKNGLYNTFVSNGYMTDKVLKELVKSGLDAINFDIKGDTDMVRRYCGADVEKIWRNAILAKNLGIHIEITTLLIQKLNTNKEIIKKIASRIKNTLGKDVPYHITQFFPRYKSLEYGYFIPTPKKLLYDASKTAKSVGLDYVYLGNVMNNEMIQTRCPKCSNLVIKRELFKIQKIGLDEQGNCVKCGNNVIRT